MPNSYSTVLLAISIFTATFAVNLQTPLYAAYAAESDVGATAVTIAFAAYVAGLMPTLIFMGGLSDRIGRRLPIALSLVLGAIATCILAIYPVWESLVTARILLGIGTGLATTAGTAYMSELLHRDRSGLAALIVTAATTLGFGGGALATSVSLGLQGYTLIPGSFVLLIVIAPILAVLTLNLPAVDTPNRESLIRLPVFPKATWVYGVAMIIAWSTSGVVIAVIPLALNQIGINGWTGLVVFLSICTGFLCQFIARRMKNITSLAFGILLTPIGFSILLIGVFNYSIALILIGTAITSSASYGFTYLAALFEVTSKAPQNRARATAGLFVYAYAGFSIPVIASGALADRIGIFSAMIIFAVVQVIASIATVVTLSIQAAYATQELS